jgi:hypothetical protein
MMNQNLSGKWIAFSIAVLIASLIAAFVLFGGNPRKHQTFEFSDGTRARLLGVSLGTNEFLEGSFLEKTFAKQIPPGGLEFLGFKLQRPISRGPIDPQAPLTAWVLLSEIPTSPAPALFGRPPRYGRAHHLWGNTRIMTANSEGREFENPFATPYSISTNQMVLAVPLYAFPRSHPNFSLRIFPPRNLGWTDENAEFELRNPFRGPHPQWAAGPIPSTNQFDDLTTVLAECSPSPVEVRFELSSIGWHLTECKLYDEEQNVRSKDSHSLAGRVIWARFEHGLETNRIWKVEAKFARGPGLLPWRESRHHPSSTAPAEYPEDELITLQVNATGPPVKIVSSAGVDYSCSFNGRELFIQRENGLDRPYFIVLGATNEMGQRVVFGNHSWSISNPMQRWSTQDPATQLNLQLASPKIVTAEFYVYPGSAPNN